MTERIDTSGSEEQKEKSNYWLRFLPLAFDRYITELGPDRFRDLTSDRMDDDTACLRESLTLWDMAHDQFVAGAKAGTLVRRDVVTPWAVKNGGRISLTPADQRKLAYQECHVILSRLGKTGLPTSEVHAQPQLYLDYEVMHAPTYNTLKALYEASLADRNSLLFSPRMDMARRSNRVNTLTHAVEAFEEVVNESLMMYVGWSWWRKVGSNDVGNLRVSSPSFGLEITRTVSDKISVCGIVRWKKNQAPVRYEVHIPGFVDHGVYVVSDQRALEAFSTFMKALSNTAVENDETIRS